LGRGCRFAIHTPAIPARDQRSFAQVVNSSPWQQVRDSAPTQLPASSAVLPLSPGHDRPSAMNRLTGRSLSQPAIATDVHCITMLSSHRPVGRTVRCLVGYRAGRLASTFSPLLNSQRPLLEPTFPASSRICEGLDRRWGRYPPVFPESSSPS
jgi:hypothetical protein